MGAGDRKLYLAAVQRMAIANQLFASTQAARTSSAEHVLTIDTAVIFLDSWAALTKSFTNLLKRLLLFGSLKISMQSNVIVPANGESLPTNCPTLSFKAAGSQAKQCVALTKTATLSTPRKIVI